MVQITIQVGGMMCGMCESHLNNAIRTAFSVKKVTASHSRGRIVIVAEETIDEAALRKVVSDTGYTVGQITQAPYEKKRKRQIKGRVDRCEKIVVERIEMFHHY